MSGVKYLKNPKKNMPATESNRRCNICDEALLDSKNSLYTNRDAGYGNIGRAHDTCIAERLEHK